MAEMVQPDVVGNYLAAYNSATDRRTAAADRQRNMQRQDVADQQQAQQFQFQMDDRQLQAALAQQEKFSRLAQWADTPEKWAQATQMAEAEGLKGAGQIPFEKRGAKLAGMLDVKTQLDQEWKRREFALKQRETEANINQSNAAAGASRAAAKGGGPGGINNASFDNISGLRKEFVGQVKDYQSVRDAYGRIKASAENPSAAGDMSLIFNYMKVLDPGSTVREGEFATAQQATGVPERIVNAYNQAINGQRLNDKQREDFVGRAGMLFQRQHQTYLSTKKNYDDLAARFGFDPTLVTMDQSAGLADQPAGPPVPQPMTWGGAAPAGLDGTQTAPATAGNVFDKANRILGISK